MNRTPLRPRTPSMPSHTDAAARSALHAALGEEGTGAVLPFLEAVVQQAALPLGEAVPVAEAPERERRTTEQVVELLLVARSAMGEQGEKYPDEAAERLRAHPLLLAAFFQNIDLLYQHGYPHADAVSLLIMRALEEPSGDPDRGVSGPSPAEPS